MKRHFLLAVFSLATIALCGCDEISLTLDDQEAECIDGQCQPKRFDGDGGNFVATWDMDLPYELRMKNWGGGSCVHASTIDALEWTGQHEMAVMWRKTYIGGESLSGLVSKCEKNGLTYAYTGNGDATFLDWANRTRRWAVIFYKPNHSINFCGYDGGDALLMDNNATRNYERVPRESFIRAWKGYGGVALVPIYSPTPPLMWVGK